MSLIVQIFQILILSTFECLLCCTKDCAYKGVVCDCETKLLWGLGTRPKWAGDTKIQSHPIGVHFIGAIETIVVPITTGKRPPPPEPSNHGPTGNSVSMDKGHVMALQLGGPDIGCNIVPQPSAWQRSGAWRRVEICIYNIAMDSYGWQYKYSPSDVHKAPQPDPSKLVYVRTAIDGYHQNGTPTRYTTNVKWGNYEIQFIIEPNPQMVAGMSDLKNPGNDVEYLCGFKTYNDNNPIMH